MERGPTGASQARTDEADAGRAGGVSGGQVRGGGVAPPQMTKETATAIALPRGGGDSQLVVHPDNCTVPQERSDKHCKIGQSC